MANKNLLLGFGETLTREVVIKSGGGEKKYPYSFEEVRALLVKELGSLLKSSSELPNLALPEGKVVSKFVLHPAFLAKSYYPEALLNAFDLEDIGSKSVLIEPRVYTRNENGPLVAPCLYVSGSQTSYEALRNHIESGDLSAGEITDVRKLEDLEEFSFREKIKSIAEGDKEAKYEVAIHTPNSNSSIVEAFEAFSRSVDTKVDLDKRISTGGLTFFPVTASPDHLRELAKFSFLRVARLMPEIRMGNPSLLRTIRNSDEPKISLPSSGPLVDDIQVGVFDGGIGCNDFDSWCEEKIYEGGASTSAELLSHGTDVTSTILFGNVSASNTELGTPYTSVKHFRVLDTNAVSGDPDLFDVLLRIQQELSSNSFDFVNFSIGPHLPIEDDEVHVWTSTIEPFLSTGSTLATIAVGNDGHLPGQNRIQPPADLVNGLAVGSADVTTDTWQRANYSCIGPGRSPGLVKPDGIAFGGSTAEPITVYSPHSGSLVDTAGTSFSAPSVLRLAIGLKAVLDFGISPLTTKALLIHHSQDKDLPQDEIGWGKFPSHLDELIYCEDNEATVIYQGTLPPSQWVRAQIPFPGGQLQGRIHLKATFCFASKTEPEHPLNYTNSGLVVTFRPKGSEQTTKPFFSLNKLYTSEQQSREDAHKWETTLHRQQRFNHGTLVDPVFDISYQARERGRAVDISELEPLPYVLVVTVRGEGISDLYNRIRQRYETLQPIQLKQEIQLQV